MIDFYILWTYHANYSSAPVKIRAYNAKEAVKNFTSFYSEDFQKKATVYAFTEKPIGVWRDGKLNLADDTESTF